MTKRELKIESPCHMQWAELKGAGAKRFCGECALHVVDGSAMTKSAAEELVESADDRVCMRVAVDKDGQAIHQPEAPAARPGLLAGIGLTIASTMLVACGEEAQEAPAPTVPTEDQPHSIPSEETEPERPHEVMGGMVYIEPDSIEMMGEVEAVEHVPTPEPEVDQTELDQAEADQTDVDQAGVDPLSQRPGEPRAELMGKVMSVLPTDESHCGPAWGQSQIEGKGAVAPAPPNE